MASIKRNTTIAECQKFVKEIYGLNNDRYFNTEDMLTQIQRFAMRGLKGIRKKDKEKININLSVSFSWFMSLLNQLHIDIDEEVWQRFPYLCSYCATFPCSCAKKHPLKRKKTFVDENKRPKTLEGFQNMFKGLYPPERRTIEDAGIHLAEELGEFSETILFYRGMHNDKIFKDVALEAADLFSCYLTTLESAGINMAEEFSKIFKNNCNVCKKAPCECSFKEITNFKS